MQKLMEENHKQMILETEESPSSKGEFATVTKKEETWVQTYCFTQTYELLGAQLDIFKLSFTF